MMELLEGGAGVSGGLYPRGKNLRKPATDLRVHHEPAFRNRRVASRAQPWQPTRHFVDRNGFMSIDLGHYLLLKQ
jgi:hypothetical protein